MAYLTAGLVLVGAVALLNLVLTTAIIRRMRKSEAKHGAGSGSRSEFGGVPNGAPLPRFTTRSADGAELTDGALRGAPVLIGFFSTDCEGCLERAPEFASHVVSGSFGNGRALAVILTGTESPDELTAAVGPATVVYEPIDRSGELSAAFRIDAFPSFFVVDADGIVIAREINRKLELAMFGGV